LTIPAWSLVASNLIKRNAQSGKMISVPGGPDQRPRPRDPAGEACAVVRVLVIQSNLAVLDAIKQTLESAGFEVTAVTSAEEGVGLFSAAAFDAAIVDIVVPGRQGLATVRRLRQHAPNVPIVALYGHAVRDRELAAADLTNMIRESSASASAFRPGDLAEALRRLVDRKEPGLALQISGDNTM
jgi:CheY-like chemotaxis protein